ncbi:hypothetical protein DAEQUDRAFT_732185 [Daedalea quercina L-15889]|uniref:Uncharacterized protein n=1 Tax=Daedalea quercina L-15889 TaxID=1314783 RepID=A0A165LTC6_9APHY|nr:hypothetical protein DAEQUDRAFT_732185 [Daedalea quercina L-15889]
MKLVLAMVFFARALIEAATAVPMMAVGQLDKRVVALSERIVNDVEVNSALKVRCPADVDSESTLDKRCILSYEIAEDDDLSLEELD